MWELFLAKNWKLIAIALVIASLAGYIGWLRWDNQHLSKEVATLNLQIEKIKESNRELTQNSADITRKYEHSLENQWALQDKLAKQNAERIKNDKITKSIVLPNVAVRLFNDADDTDPVRAVAKAVGVNAGKTNTTEEPGVVDLAAPSGKTLNDLLAVADENRTNHLKCVAQVEEWQKFWFDYVAAVNAAEAKAKANNP